jgi:UDP-3-O-[3-hydroxymyristoyl] N-acetylglucosamine deacetylase
MRGYLYVTNRHKALVSICSHVPYINAMTQITLKKSVTAQGVGLHSGAKVTLTLHPAAANHGIVFQRLDIANEPTIPALWNNVSDTRMCTLISNEDGVSVGTIEHLMSALRALHVDNVLVTLDGPEVPIMDGSAEPFQFLVQCAGLETQDAVKKRLLIKKTIRVQDGDKWAEFTPSNIASYDFIADFKHPLIGEQSHSLALVNGNYPSQISRARTFTFTSEIEQLRSIGLIKGGSLDNAIVLDEQNILNENGLRFPDEFVRHKILDAVGDLYLAGLPIMGHYTGHKAGHALNNQLLRALFADSDAYIIA